MAIEDRLATLQDQLLSRSRLEQIIADLDLAWLPQAEAADGRGRPANAGRHTVQLESSASNARNKDSASFRILYVSNEAATAQRTTERLASLFIEENIRDRAKHHEARIVFSKLNCWMPGAGWRNRKET